ncbi:hypothetical protein [Tepidiforma sp.]|uniref:hypothetical protein n=1 Tax=Tepidiforma sp. TaxID=2682230 RepID=UPI002ADE0BE3|nr:hypothetical protein [Tepidiforma sp.]
MDRSQPGRRLVLQTPSPDRQGRTGCIAAGAIIGVLVGLMVGLYALPPILRSIYGETKVAAGQTFEGDGRIIAVEAVGIASEPLGQPSPGMQRHDVSLRLRITNNKTWDATLASWTLEVDGIENWIPAAEATTNGSPGFDPPLGQTSTVELHFIVQRPASETSPLRLEALHLATPRVRFALE